MSTKLQELKDQINVELDLCTPEETPTVCSAISTESGRKKVINMIVEKVFYSNMSISQAIVDIEDTYNPNAYAD
jgi:hypothetical protein